jgi:hypothetical protein
VHDGCTSAIKKIPPTKYCCLTGEVHGVGGLQQCFGFRALGGTGLKTRTKIDQNSAQQILRSWAGVDDGVGRISPKSITEAMLSRAFRPVVSVAARAEAGTYTCMVAPLFMCRDAHDW